MKIIYRIPAKEQYGYIEIEREVEEKNLSESIKDYDQFVEAYKKENGTGLTQKDFDRFLDHYLLTNTGSTEVYAQMNPEQQKQIQSLKRAFKRIKYHEENDN